MRGIDELTEMEKQTEKETDGTDMATMIKTIYDYIIGANNDDDEKEEVLEETEDTEEKEEIKENEGE